MNKTKQDKSVLFAQLAAVYKSLNSLIGPQGTRGRLYPSFDLKEVEQYFTTYSDLKSSLEKLNPDLYFSIPDRVFPLNEQYVDEDKISRTFVELFIRDIEYIFEIYSQHSSIDSKKEERLDKIFISHGSSKYWMEVQNYIEKDLEIETIELAQRPNLGRTVIQKLNEESDNCSYAVVVMTGDDKISEDETRARENVMHEIGYFQGKYGIEKVCLLHEEGTNIPSNIHGLVYIPFPKEVISATFGSLVRELKIHFNF